MRKILLSLGLGCFVASAFAQEGEVEESHVLLHGTYVWQKKPAFNAQPGALVPLNQADKNYSFNAVLHLAKRVWSGGEVYLNLEAEQTAPFRGIADVGGPTNKEDARGRMTYYPSRLFLRQVWGLGGGREAIVSSENQLGGMVDKDRFVLTAGRFSLIDIFGKNTYTFDPTVTFMNWSNTTYAAYDFASDPHGMTSAVAGEWYQGAWTWRLGLAAVPSVQYGFSVAGNVLRRNSSQIEIEHRHQLAGMDGKARLLLWRNRGLMGRYQDAIAYKNLNNQIPDTAAVRFADRVKYGVGMDVEQAITSELGIFARVMMTDGQSEVQSYLDVDNSAAAGIALKGHAWSRPDDMFGLVAKENSLSSAHRAYLQTGGVSPLVTEGWYQYRPQNIFEAYYNWQFKDGVQFTVDYQRVHNPSFNAFRGPINIYGARLHVEY